MSAGTIHSGRDQGAAAEPDVKQRRGKHKTRRDWIMDERMPGLGAK